MLTKTKRNILAALFTLSIAIFPLYAFAIENLLVCETVKECILMAISNLLWIVTGVTVVVIIIAGIMYIFSGANVSLAERAKNAFVGAALGFAIVVGAQILISQVGCALGWKGAENCQGAHGIIERTITFLFSILGAIGIGGILIGAIYYLSSSGDEQRMQTGRKIVIYSIIGTVIALSAVIIVRQVEKITLG